MKEIIDLLFNPLSNAVMTALTGISLIYWLFTMLMGDGFDFGDTHVNMDVAADVPDTDTADDGNVDTDAEPSFFTKMMDYINIGKVPVMVIVTLFKFIGWIITLVSSLVFHLAEYGTKSVLILIPVFVLTYFILHWVSKPLVRVYANVGYNGEEALDLMGRVGKMKSSIEGEHIGSAEFVIQQDVIRLNVRSNDRQKISYGDQVIIVDESADKKYYYVTKDINLDNI